MELSKLTRNQWIALGLLVAIVILMSVKFTRWWHGEAIEISVQNASDKPIFVYIDNTGRHGISTLVDKIQTTKGDRAPDGLLLKPTQTRSFGTAVGLGDSPTLHVLPVTDDARADATLTNDCVFDTVSFKKLQIPAHHIKLIWTGKGCEISQ
jgi:hypothetical protein